MDEIQKAMHIEKISIRNFKAIHNLEYIPRQINILTGRNNTGKSTILTAIALNAPFNDSSELEDTFIENPSNFITVGEKTGNINSNLNSVSIYLDSNEVKKKDSHILSEFFEKDFQNLEEILSKSDLKKIINDKNFQNDYIILFNENFDLLTLNSDFNTWVCPYYKQNISSGKQYREFSKNINSNFKKLLKNYSEKDTPRKGGRLESIFYRIGMYPGNIVLREKEKPTDQSKKIVKLDHYNKLEFDDVTEEELVLLTEFILTNNIVKNLKRLSQNEVVYQRENSLVTIPISAHGDGFKALLNTIRYLVKAKDSILLIEEPENHLHPRYVDIFVETIFKYSKKLNVQVFMSTHSLDLIRAALNYPENDEEKEMLLISKMTSDGQTVEKFDYTVDKGLKIVNELYLDLRGN
ncbi:MAG: ATP-binding protein [Methanoregula sp.]|jgi:AAA15 family ATPase/GTPase